MARRSSFLLLPLAGLVLAPAATPAADPAEALAAAMETPLKYIQKRGGALDLEVSAEQLRDGEWRPLGQARILDFQDGRFHMDLSLASGEGGHLHRTADSTILHMGHRDAAFVGEGAVSRANQFAPREMLLDILDIDARARLLAPALLTADPRTLAAGVTALVRLPDGAIEATDSGWRFEDGTTTVSVDRGGGLRELMLGDTRVRIQARLDPDAVLPGFQIPETARVEQVDRDILERTLRRGIVRAAEIQHENANWTPPADGEKRVPGGILVIEGGHRLMVLDGPPEVIGAAQGRLLAPEIRKVVDSTLYTVGLVYSVGTGKWFPSEIREAWDRLEPHTPPEYLAEIHAMADAAGIDREELLLANFFPELFHCSGFAVRNTATIDGKLYHGRVLDYMTNIGLQYIAVVAVYQQPGKITWANVGYAGFAGSVTGMNMAGISIGEMGGRGEGDWDGMPMAQLIRYGLENAETLGELKDIFRQKPRTCEYFYVFADGNTNEAVGVYATPEILDFITFGEKHELLPRSVSDAVLMSQGNRFDILCDRVEAAHGAIDAEKAIRLMDRGVAISGANLHNVLMVPEDGVMWVANAGPRGRIAAEMEYVRYDLHDILARYGAQREVASGIGGE